MRHNFGEEAIFRKNMTFGEFLRKKRRLMGLNQTDFGKQLLTDPNTISKWERDVTSPRFEDARLIIEDLGGEVLIVNRREAPKVKLKGENEDGRSF